MHVINTVNHPGSTKLSTKQTKEITKVNSVARLTVLIRAYIIVGEGSLNLQCKFYLFPPCRLIDR